MATAVANTLPAPDYCAYEPLSERLAPATLEKIERANLLVRHYGAQGYVLTLRQVFYQFVSRNWIANTDAAYTSLGDAVAKGRLGGAIPWNYMEDRTRRVQSLAHFADPADAIRAVASQYQPDLWADQDTHLEVWIEKDALLGVISGVCEANDVSYFSCRGYSSLSAAWNASQRLLEAWDKGQGKQNLVVVYLGDHDPSGQDMVRAAEERLRQFVSAEDLGAADFLRVEHIALTKAQIDQYNLPPQPLKRKRNKTTGENKLSDSRAKGYMERHGQTEGQAQSWELDALEPSVIAGLVEDAIRRHRNDLAWRAAVIQRNLERNDLRAAAAAWGSDAAAE